MVGSALSYIVKRLTNDQIKDLYSSPITILPAPGEGKLLIPVTAVVVANIFAVYGGFDTESTLRLARSEDSFGGGLVPDDFLDTIGTNVALVPLLNEGSHDGDLVTVITAAENLVNKPIVIFNDAQDNVLSGGDSRNSIQVHMSYLRSIIQLTPL